MDSLTQTNSLRPAAGRPASVRSARRLTNWPTCQRPEATSCSRMRGHDRRRRRDMTENGEQYVGPIGYGGEYTEKQADIIHKAKAQYVLPAN